MAHLFRYSLIVCLAALLTACGGGGGGGAPGGSTTPPPGGGNPPPPPPVLQPIHLEPQGYQYSARSAGILIDFSVSFAKFGSSVFGFMLARGGTASYTDSCPTSGTITFEVVDSDSNGQLNAGDRIVARSDNCTSFDTAVDSVTNVDVQSISNQATQSVAVLRVTITSYEASQGTQSGTIAGGLDVTWTETANTDRFEITGTRMTLAGAFGDHVLENFQHDLLENYTTFQYRLSLRGSVASQTVGGTFTFETEAPLLGLLGSYPEAGVLTLHGAQSAVRLEEGADGEQLGNEVGISADFDGNGIFEPGHVALLWLELFDMSFFDSARPGVTVPADAPRVGDLKGRAVTLTLPRFSNILADIAVDPVRDQLYVSAPLTNEVVVVSTSTYHAIDRIGVGSSPLGLHMPAAGSALFVALNRGGGIARLDPQTRQVTRINTAVANNHSRPSTVTGSGSQLFTAGFGSANQGTQVPAYYARVDLAANTVERLADYSSKAFGAPMVASSDGRYLYTSEPRFNGEMLVKHDVSLPNAPVAASLEVDFMDAQGMVLSPDGTILVLLDGRVLRTSDFSQIATIQSSQSLAFSTDGSELIAYWGSLIIYDGHSFITKRTFVPDCPGSSLGTKVAHVASHDQWVLMADNAICAMSINDPLNAPGQAGSPEPPAPLMAQPLQPTVEEVFTPLDQNGSDIVAGEIDRQHGLIYLGGMRNSVPEVAVLSLADLSIQATIPLQATSQPYSLAFDATGQRLYANVDGDHSTIPVIDTSTNTALTSLTYPSDLFGATAYGMGDAQWIGNGKLLITGRSNGEKVRMATMNVGTGMATPIAGGAERFLPGVRLLITPDQKTAFVQGGFSNAGFHLERIDLTLPDPDVSLERASDELDGATMGTMSADGKLLYFSGGNVVDAATLMLVGQTAKGMQLPTPDGSTVYALESNLLSVFDGQTYQLRALYSIGVGCGGSNFAFARFGNDARDIIWALGSRICRVTVPQ